jgi:tetraacyldisaccharide 4'-kinase
VSYPVTDLRGARRVGGGGPAAGAAALLYGTGAAAFHALHELGWLPRRRARLPVVSIGALTVGGSGKTPVTRWLAERLRERGRRPAILSRGYRSAGGKAPRVVDPERPDPVRDGDEPALLARSLPSVPVVVGADRVAAGALARGRGADVLLLDDGFQHRRLRRDADVVLWDRTAEAADGRLLPAGALREPRRGVRRADLLVLVDRGDGLPGPPRGAPPAEHVFRARLVPGSRQRIEEGRAVHALSGVANPESFERSLQSLGLRVTGATRFPDHHPFSAAEIRAAARRAVDEEADLLAVTAKDHVRWPRPEGKPLPVPAVFDLDVELESADAFLRALDTLLQEAPP